MIVYNSVDFINGNVFVCVANCDRRAPSAGETSSAVVFSGKGDCPSREASKRPRDLFLHSDPHIRSRWQENYRLVDVTLDCIFS